MKKRSKTLAALGLLLALGLTLTGCDNISAIMGGGQIDGVAYMQGFLDVRYKGIFDPEYLKSVDLTEEGAREVYDENAQAETDIFISGFNVEYPTEEFKARMAELYKTIYAKSDYTVVSSAKQDDDSYSVKITVRPLDIIQLMDGKLDEFSETFEAKFADVDTDAMTEEEFEDWYENTYDFEYQNGLADLMESLIPEMGYMDEKSIAVQIEKDPDDGYYVINEESFQSLDALIIDYN